MASNTRKPSDATSPPFHNSLFLGKNHNEMQIRTPPKFVVGRPKFWVPGHIIIHYVSIKDQRLCMKSKSIQCHVISVYVCPGTASFDLPTPIFAEIFWVRNEELKGPGVSGTEGDNSVARCEIKTNFIFGFPIP